MANSPNYADFANIKTAKQKKEERTNAIVSADITSIENALKSDDIDELKNIHMHIEAKYGSVIPSLGVSCYNYSTEFGFDYEYTSNDSLKHNLKLFKSKLEGYLCDFPIHESNAALNNISVNVSNNNEFNIAISFEHAKQKIEDMPGLTDADTDSIKEKIDELESISKEGISKKKKWETNSYICFRQRS